MSVSVGPVAVDVGHMGWNLAVDYGPDAADAFLRLYRSLVSNAADDQDYRNTVTLLDFAGEAMEPHDFPGRSTWTGSSATSRARSAARRRCESGRNALPRGATSEHLGTIAEGSLWTTSRSRRRQCCSSTWLSGKGSRRVGPLSRFRWPQGRLFARVPGRALSPRG